jgi:hypothetical protein
MDALDFNDLTNLGQALQKMQHTTTEVATSGHEVAQAQVNATKELADAIRILAGAIHSMAVAKVTDGI